MMKKITNPVSGIILNFRAARVAALTVALVASLGALLPSTAQAQRRYIGNAYTANVDVDIASAVNVGVNLNDTGNLAPFTQQTLNGLGVGAGLNVNTGGLTPLSLLTVANVQTVQTTSDFPATINPLDTVVLSTARVTGVNLLGNLVSSLLGLNITADVIQSQTTAFYSGQTQGSTILTNLNLGSAFVNANGTPAVVATVAGQIVANQVFQVSVLSGLGGSLLNVGTLTINEQIINADDSRTTNAIHLALLDNNVLGNLANANIIVASSTAGYAPEPGSLSLLAASLLPILGLALRQRRRRADASV